MSLQTILEKLEFMMHGLNEELTQEDRDECRVVASDYWCAVFDERAWIRGYRNI